MRRRLQSCPSTFNCVSTSSRSSDQYTSPWVAPVATSADAADIIVDAVRFTCPQAELLSSQTLPSGQYLRFHVPGARTPTQHPLRPVCSTAHRFAGKFSLPDELEFLIRNTGVTGRNFSADDDGGLLVTVRSIAGTVQCALHSPARLLLWCSLTPVRAAQMCTPS